MRNIFPSRFFFEYRKTAAIFPAVILAFSVTGAAQAQSQDRPAENATVIATAKGKTDSNKSNGGNKEKKADKKSSKRNAGENSANYRGAQPPQGGRAGQGPSEDTR
ncbi:MAG TPA: hypothetical protein VHB01_04485 [Nitrosospira sp.]|nr:hypothetical protein [Nitrosospira sp.]